MYCEQITADSPFSLHCSTFIQAAIYDTPSIQREVSYCSQEMDELPPEILRIILGHLNLNHLARCGRVSRSLRRRAEEVLSTVTCIYHTMDSYDDIENLSQHLSFAIRNSAPKYTSYQAWFTDATTGSFLRFVTKKCPRLCSLIATHHRVLMKDISALAGRITFLVIGNVVTKWSNCMNKYTIDVKTLAAIFPRLKFYHISYGYNLCLNDIRLAYKELWSTQIINYHDHCLYPHTCRPNVDVRSIRNLFSISVKSSLVLSDLQPSSLNSLQFLDLERPPSDLGCLPHLPNLSRATLICEDRFNKIIHWLLNSPRLAAVFLTGEINERSIPPLNLLLVKCTALRVFHLTSFSFDESIVDNPDLVLDLTHPHSLKNVMLKKCYSNAGIPRMAIRVILPPNCDKIDYCSGHMNFSIDGRVYWLGDRAVSFNAMSAFTRPIGLVMRGSIELSSADRLLRLCPRVSRLIFYFEHGHSSEKVRSIFQSLLANSDVSNIIISSWHWNHYGSPARDFFSEINKYQDRSFSVVIRGIERGYNFQSILGVISRNHTISYVDFGGQLETRVEIPPAVNVLPICIDESWEGVSR